jgi:single-strand DNA-binding protein
VIVQGRLVQRSYETREGEKRTVVEMQVDEIGPALRYATAKINKVNRNSGGGFGGGNAGGGSRGSQAPTDDPWNSAPAASAYAGAPAAGAAQDDEPPF